VAYFHPSSGAHTTVSTASGICHTLTADSSSGVTNTICCRYSLCAPDDGWKYHPKHVEQFPDINKLCNVASCWIYIYIYWNILKMHVPINIKSPNNTSKWQMGFNCAFKGLKLAGNECAI